MRRNEMRKTQAKIIKTLGYLSGLPSERQLVLSRKFEKEIWYYIQFLSVLIYVAAFSLSCLSAAFPIYFLLGTVSEYLWSTMLSVSYL